MLNSLFFSDAIKYLCELLQPIQTKEHTEWIDKIIESIQKMTLTSTLITKEVIHKAAEVEFGYNFKLLCIYLFSLRILVKMKVMMWKLYWKWWIFLKLKTWNTIKKKENLSYQRKHLYCMAKQA